MASRRSAASRPVDGRGLERLVRDRLPATQGLQPDLPDVADVRVGHYVGAGQDLIRFEPIDCKVGQAAACPGGFDTGGPGGFTYGDYGKVFTGPEVHSDGEIRG